MLQLENWTNSSLAEWPVPRREFFFLISTKWLRRIVLVKIHKILLKILPRRKRRREVRTIAEGKLTNELKVLDVHFDVCVRPDFGRVCPSWLNLREMTNKQIIRQKNGLVTRLKSGWCVLMNCTRKLSHVKRFSLST